MSDDEAASGAAPPLPMAGWRRLLAERLMRPARICAVETLGAHFRLIDFEGAALRGGAWLPGQKLQVRLDGRFALRTYTPVRWDGDAGLVRIVGYAHGDGPGSAWLSAARPGDARYLVGPRRAVDLRGLSRHALLFGDETTFALAVAARLAGLAPARCVFEVRSSGETAAVLARLGLLGAHIVERRIGDVHLDEVEAVLTSLSAPGADLILAGRADAIRRLGRRLRHSGGGLRLRSKVHWAPGRAGLD